MRLVLLVYPFTLTILTRAREYILGVVAPGKDLWKKPWYCWETHVAADIAASSMSIGLPTILSSKEHHKLRDNNVTIKILLDSGKEEITSMGKTNSDDFDVEVAWHRATKILPKVDAILVADISDTGVIVQDAASHYGMPNAALSGSGTLSNRGLYPYTFRVALSSNLMMKAVARLFESLNIKRWAALGAGRAHHIKSQRSNINYLASILMSRDIDSQFPWMQFVSFSARGAPNPNEPKVVNGIKEALQLIKVRMYRIIFVPNESPLIGHAVVPGLLSEGFTNGPFTIIFQDQGEAKEFAKNPWNGWLAFESPQNVIPNKDNVAQKAFIEAFREYGPGSSHPYVLEATHDIWNAGWKAGGPPYNHSTSPMNVSRPYLVYDSLWAMALGFAELENAKKQGWWKPGSDVNAMDANGLSGLYYAMQNVTFSGVTGKVAFGADGEAYADYLLYNSDNESAGNLKVVGAYYGKTDTLQVGGSYPAFRYADNLEGIMDRPPVCNDGYIQNGSLPDQMDICQACFIGTKAGAGASFCVDCHAGTYAANEGQGVCDPCPAGFAQSLRGQSSCDPCTAGKYAQNEQSRTCLDCAAGTVSGNASAGCDMCDAGYFQDSKGETACISCESTFAGTTSNRGAKSEAECVCPAGTYDPRKYPSRSSKDACLPCPAGLNCASDGITVLRGFYVDLPLDPSRGAWKCRPPSACPGGYHEVAYAADASGSVCKSRLEGLNCALCADGTYKDAATTCSECADSSFNYLGLPIALLVMFFTLGSFHYLWTFRSGSVEVVESVLASVTIGCTLSFIQTLGIMNRLKFSWPEEFQNVLNALSIFLFDLTSLKLSCIYRPTLATTYLGRLMVPVCITACAVLGYGLSQILNKIAVAGRRFPKFDSSAVFNSNCMVLQAIYISVVSSVVSLYECYESGPKPVRERVLNTYSWIVCSSSEHMSMVPASVIWMLVFVIGFLGLLVYLAFVAPQQYYKDSFSLKVRFLVFKFRPDCWWYGIILVLRSLALAFIPVVSPDDGYVQFLLMLWIFVGGLLFHLAVLPYSDFYANALETAEVSILVIMLGLGSWFMEDRDYDGDDKHQAKVLAGLLVASVVVCIILLFGVFVYAMDLLLRPKAALAVKEKQAAVLAHKLQKACLGLAELTREQVTNLLVELNYIDWANVEHISKVIDLEVFGMMSDSKSLQRLTRGNSMVKLKDDSSEALSEVARRMSHSDSVKLISVAESKREAVSDSKREDVSESKREDVSEPKGEYVFRCVSPKLIAL